MFRTLAAAIILLTLAVQAQGEFVFRYKYGDENLATVPIADVSFEIKDLYVGEDASLRGTVDGGTGSVTWSLSGEALPPGMQLDPSGILYGTPSVAGTYPGITFSISDSAGQSMSYGPNSITVLDQVGLEDLTHSVRPGNMTAIALLASGGRSPFNYEIVSGSLPSGMELSGNQITGIPYVAGTYDAVIRATDRNGRSDIANIRIVAASDLVASAEFVEAYAGSSYTGYLLASGGEAPYSWSIVSGLPGGLNLASNGTVSGIPSSSGNYDFVARVTDSSFIPQSAYISVPLSVYSLPSLSAPALPDGYVGQAYPTSSFSAYGGKVPLTFSLDSGSLPGGLSLSASGQLSGMPTASGTSSFSVMVSDANGRTAAVGPLTVGIYDYPAITASQPEDAYVAQAYPGHSFSASGGKAPLTWAASGLPAGMQMSPDGEITGTPSASGTFQITVGVTDANGKSVSRQVPFTVREMLLVTVPGLVDGYVGEPYAAVQLSASGGERPYTWTLEGSLPAGLTFSDGSIFGSPTAAGTTTFTVAVTDANGIKATATASIAVYGVVTVSASTPPDGYMSRTYPGHTFQRTGGKAPFTWSLASGSLPDGLTLSSEGTVAGTPKTSGTANFTVMVEDANGNTATHAVNMTIRSLPAIAGSVPPDGYLSQPYAGHTFTASGGKAPYTWSLASGSLPEGIMLSSGGSITGTPTAVGTSTFSIRLQDAGGVTATRPVTLVVRSMPVITSGLPASMVTRTSYTRSNTVSGGVSPYTWSATNLPSGLSINASTGQVTGTPTVSGSFSPVLKVVDANGKAATRTVALSVTPGTISKNMSAGGSQISLQSQFSASDWADPHVNKQVIIPSGVIRGSTTRSAAVIVGSTPWDGTLTLRVDGEIQGSAGVAGTSGAGGAGGHAFNANITGKNGQKVMLAVNGYIRAGGGGGGKGGKGGTGGGGVITNSVETLDMNYATRTYMGTSNTSDKFSWYWGGTLVGTTNYGVNTLKVGSVTYSKGSQSIILRGPPTPGCPTGCQTGTAWSIVKTSGSTNTSGGAGGDGGSGGRGQGYTLARASGAAGANGSAGGTNAGAGGKGGTGGTGGTWGTAGGKGGTGAKGVDGNRTAGLAGAAGSAGGASGYAIYNYSNVTVVSGAARIIGTK